MSELAKALLDFQKNAPELHLDSDGVFNNRYIGLPSLIAAVRPALNAAGLVLLQLPTSVEGAPALRTRLIHAESGEADEDVMPLLLDKNNAQGLGSALTYARRQSLLAILALAADEDDDANAASTRSAGEPKSEARSPSGSARNVASVPIEGRAGEPSPSAVPTEAADVVIGFGKNKDRRLGDLSPKQLEWYANVWVPNPQFESDEDRILKTAAQQLVAA